MDIKIREKDLGECNIHSYKNIDKKEEYAIKALCALQLMCMNANEDPEKFREFMSILKDTVRKADALFNEEGKEIDATDQFYGY
jgi:hypothetical protein